MPPKARREKPAWVDPVADQGPPVMHPPWMDNQEVTGYRFARPRDDPIYQPPPKKAPVKEWCNPNADNTWYEDDSLHKPVWAAEVVTPEHIPGLPQRKVRRSEYVHPEDDPRYTGPKKKGPNDPNEVWECPYCGAMWYALEPGTCPQCGVQLMSARPTKALMDPLIEACRMIDEGHDPRDGLIDKRLDQLLDEQAASVGIIRERGKAPPKMSSKRRVITVDPSEIPKNKDPNIIYVPIYQMTKADIAKKPTCICCRMPIKSTQRVAKLDCGHIFHVSCLTQYLKTKDDCPDCHVKIQ